jgi:NhaP-type Na+/H+ or K+/H+ antiporter
VCLSLLPMPANASVVHLAYLAFTCGLAFFTTWLLLGKTMLPGGAGWSLALLYLCSTVAGKLVPLVSKRLPPLLGMLAVGLLLRNVPGGALDSRELLLGEEFAWWSRWLRAAALAVIMLRAGLGLDLDKLRTLGLATARLAFLPCLAEALTALALAQPLLDLPPQWGGTLGFVLAAVSPAVVVPGMLDLGSRGYGVSKGVPTMVVAAASFDDVLCIAGFGVCLALADAHEAARSPSAPTNTSGLSGGASSDDVPIAWLVLKAPTELLCGILYGWIAGALCAP